MQTWPTKGFRERERSRNRSCLEAKDMAVIWPYVVLSAACTLISSTAPIDSSYMYLVSPRKYMHAQRSSWQYYQVFVGIWPEQFFFFQKWSLSAAVLPGRHVTAAATCFFSFLKKIHHCKKLFKYIFLYEVLNITNEL